MVYERRPRESKCRNIDKPKRSVNSCVFVRLAYSAQSNPILLRPWFFAVFYPRSNMISESYQWNEIDRI